MHTRLVDTLGGGDGIHLVGESLLVDTAVRKIHLGIVVIEISEGVLHPSLIITLLVVITGMGTTGLAANEATLEHGEGIGEHIAELESLNKIAVPDGALVVDDNVAEVLVALGDNIKTLGHILLSTEDGGVVSHGLLHALTNASHRNITLVVENLVKVSDRLLAAVGGELRLSAALLSEIEDNSVSARLAEDNNVQKRVGTKAVSAVDAGAGALTGSQKSRNNSVVIAVAGVDNLASPKGGHAAHSVVDGRNDGNGLLGDVNTGEGAGGLSDTRELRLELLLGKVVELEEDVVLLGAAAAAGEDLHGDGAGDDIAGGKIKGLGGVARHEALTLGVDEVASLTAGTLGNKDTGAVDASGVELDELHIRRGEASTVNHSGTVTSAGLGGGGGEPAAAKTAGGENSVLRAEAVDGTVVDAHRHDAAAHAIVDHKVKSKVLIEEVDAILEGLAVERVEHSVAGTIRSGAGTTGNLLTIVNGLTAKGTLVDEAVLGAEEGEAHILHLGHDAGRLLAEVLNSVLIAEPIATLNGVVHVPAPIVLLAVSEGGIDTTLGSDSVRTRGVKLGDAGNIEASGSNAHGGTKTGATSTDDNAVEGVVNDGVRLVKIEAGRPGEGTAKHSFESIGSRCV